VADDGLPLNVRAFITEHIDSVVQLEILLLLFRAAPAQRTAEEMGRELCIDPKWAAGQLMKLCAAGVLSCTEGSSPAFQYSPGTPQRHEQVVGLAHAYADRRVRVISLIFSKPMEQLRSFADAFRFRKEKNDG
jgi:hypothetical protein